MVAGRNEEGLIDARVVEIVGYGGYQRGHYFEITEMPSYLQAQGEKGEWR
jgi:hypothetical protein